MVGLGLGWFRVLGLGLGLGFRVLGLGFWSDSFGFRVFSFGLGFRVWVYVKQATGLFICSIYNLSLFHNKGPRIPS